MVRIAIIGGGPASVSLCLELKKSLQGSLKSIEILVFEKNSRIGPGLPYAKKENSHLLNLPKQTMEPLSGEKDYFVQWLKQQGLDTESTFPPRYLFGEYLEHRAIIAQLEAEHEGLSIQYLVNNEVSSIKQLDQTAFQIHAVQGSYTVDYVILGTGHMPSTLYREWIGHPKYIHNPLVSGIFKDIDPDESITLIGSRLTAIDAALKLKRMGHRGRLTMVSRSGLLPTVLSKAIGSYSLKYLTLDGVTKKAGTEQLSLNDFALLFFKELSSLDSQSHLNKFPKSSREINALDWITNEINEAEDGNRSWQEFLFALYPLTPQFWSMLNAHDQSLFMEQWYGLFITYLAAFPLENAHRVKSLLTTGELSVFGGFQRIEKADGCFLVYCEDQPIIRSDWLINTTGPGYDITSLPLFKCMLDSGIVIAHPLGGLYAEQDTLRVLHANGTSQRRLFALGELTKGINFLTTDLGCVTAHARTISGKIVEDLRQYSQVNHVIPV
jgi:uncharacterized NAD(P)/FAD-binding protein YdhS